MTTINIIGGSLQVKETCEYIMGEFGVTNEPIIKLTQIKKTTDLMGDVIKEHSFIRYVNKRNITDFYELN